MYLRDIWYTVALHVTNWGTFVRVCKMFHSFAPELEDLKYDRIKSILNLFKEVEVEWQDQYYSSLISDSNPCFKHFKECIGELDGSSDEADNEEEASPLPKGCAWNDIINHLEEGIESNLAVFLTERDDLTMSKVEELESVFTPEAEFWFYTYASCNLKLDPEWLLKRLVSKYIYQSRISSHPGITRDMVESYPMIKWDYPSLAANMILEESDIEWLLQKCSKRPYLVHAALPDNPNITYQMLKGYVTYQEPYPLESILSSSKLTYQDIKELKDKGFDEYRTWELGVLLNPNLTLRQTVELLETH